MDVLIGRDIIMFNGTQWSSLRLRRLQDLYCSLSRVQGQKEKQRAIGNWLSIFTNSDDSHGDELLTVVRHYVAKMSKGVISAMHSGWSERYQGRLKVTPNLPLGARVMGPW